MVPPTVDTALLAPAIQGDDRTYALKLMMSTSPADTTAWQSGSTVDWANNTHAFAVGAIYGSLPHEGGV